LLPPIKDIRNPATTAVNRPFSGETFDAIAIAIDSGSATIATTRPDKMSFDRYDVL
jgi:hypothetical protein